MNMVEVAYQLRGSADFIVGSEEVEPGDGWPYDRVLADLAAKPTMSAAQLGATIVKRYASLVQERRGDAVPARSRSSRRRWRTPSISSPARSSRR